MKISSRLLDRVIFFAALIPTCILLSGCTSPRRAALPVPVISKWDRFEQTFESAIPYQNPVQQAELRVTFISPSGETRRVLGFWDGNSVWRVRFSPNEIGTWKYTTSCSDPGNAGLHGQSGSFLCTAPANRTPFSRHGPVQLSRHRHYLAHEDGTPFFWLADTAWNGPLLATPNEWRLYIQERLHQKFSAVQWVATQWRAAPAGDLKGQIAFSGLDRIMIYPSFFQRLDEKVEMLDRAGLLNAPVLLWANQGGAHPQVNPGVSLPENQAILLAKYMVARWGGNHVLWILAGDGDYRGANAERWKRIARAVFNEIDHAPLTLHPAGMHWVLNEFRDEPWYSIAGYQSGHGESPEMLRWIFDGPPAHDWAKNPAHPFINLEPPYEFHIAYHSKTRISPHTVRRALYWSLLNAPTAGVSYGGHGVWGWDDGTRAPIDHPDSGVPLPLGNAVVMPGAQQIAYLQTLFTSIPFWDLRPAPDLIAIQPGTSAPERHISAARAPNGEVAVVYLPAGREVALNRKALPDKLTAAWFNPRTGDSEKVAATLDNKIIRFTTPNPEPQSPANEPVDWVLVIRKAE